MAGTWSPAVGSPSPSDTASLFSAPLIFFESWSDTFGWARGTISNAFSLTLLVVALASPGVGKNH